MIYDKHLFICTNERKNSDRKSCGEAHGLELISAFKAEIKKENIPLKIRAQKSGCLDICDFGPTVVVYPDGVFYVGVQVSDVPEIVQEHLMHNRPVERLRLKNDYKK
jgi:(2Fe-2S) ferredoxin